jgi:hypothetical protein
MTRQGDAVASPIGVGNDKGKLNCILLFLDEKKQKSSDRTEFTKNLMLTLKHFYSTASQKCFLTRKQSIFLT